MTKKERQNILDWIRSENAAGEALNLHAVKRRRPDLLKEVYAVRPFWGWWQAIADAGLDYDKLKVELEEKVACAICGFSGLQLNSHLTHRHGITSVAYRDQFPGVEISSEARRARMRREDVEALLPHWEPLYSDEYLMDRTYRYHRLGYSLRTTWVCEHDRNLWQQIHRQGLTWESFVTEMGIPYNEDLPLHPSRMTQEALLEGLREVAREEGRTPGIKRLAKLNHALVTGIERHFRSYDEALEAAELPLPVRHHPRRRNFSPAVVLAELKELAARGHHLTAVGIRDTLRRQDLHHAIERMGGYPAIRRQLGIVKPAHGRTQPHHTREEVIAAFRKQASEGEAFTVRGMKRGSESDRILLSSVRSHFKRWTDLLKAAELVPEHHAIARARKHREDLLEELRQQHEAGGSLDRRRMRGAKESKNFYLSCHRAFGTWEKALCAAGLPVELADEKILRQSSLAAEIQAVHAAGQALAPVSMRSTPAGLDLFSRATSAFGTWKKALLSAGFEWPQKAPSIAIKKDRPKKALRPAPPRRRDLRREEREERERAIIEAIRNRQLNKKTLRLRNIRWEPEGKELYDRARLTFKSWKAALKAAGCEAEVRPPRKVSKIVRELELDYPIDPSSWEAIPAGSEDKTGQAQEKGAPEEASTLAMPLRGWRQPGKGAKQRSTPAKARGRKKRK